MGLSMNIGLGLTARRGLPWTPARLFALAEPGAWYDPSDLSTLFQDSAGSTPVTTPGQTVGMVLDKSRGLVLGNELVTNGGFDSDISGWSANAGAILTHTGSSVRATRNGANDFGVNQVIPTVAGKTYRISISRSGGSAPGFYANLTNYGNWPSLAAHSGTVIGYFTSPTSNVTLSIRAYGSHADGTTIEFDNISVKEIPGAHLIQATAASRPVYGVMPEGGVRNLLTHTANLPAWTNAGIIVSGQTMTEDTSSGLHRTRSPNTYSIPSGQSATVRVKVSKSSTRRVYLNAGAIMSAGALFHIAPGVGAVVATSGSPTASTITEESDGFVLTLSGLGTTTANGVYIQFCPITHTTATDVSYAGDGTSALTISNPQLEYGSTASAYQRVGANAYDVTESGKRALHYLNFDGVDDGMATAANLNLSATDKLTVWAGVHKASDAGTGALVELSASSTDNAGAFAIFAPLGAATPNFAFRSKGTLHKDAIAGGVYPAPQTVILTGQGDIAGDVSRLRVNGVERAFDGGDQGTGTFGSYPLYIGRRNLTSLPFNGRLYGLVIRGAATSDPGPGERWMAQRTGVSI